jgi:mitochondrial enoyl-[acyl-carrier protein] reductase / trans-2-enoyl-CoA reductase
MLLDGSQAANGRMLRSHSRRILRRCSLNVLPRYVFRSDRCYHELSYAEPGPPRSNLKYYTVPKTKKEEEDSWIAPWDGTARWVRVKMIAAPWNPADALSVQGVYPSPWERERDPDAAFVQAIRRSAFAPHKMVAGSEGWARVVDIYPDEEDTTSAFADSSPAVPLQVGDYVVPGISGLGTLRSSLWAPESHWIRLERGRELYDALGPFAPAAFFQTGGTAWRMLHDFDKLHSPGDVVVQNAGNSAVGFMVSQISTAILKIPCISLIRTRNRTPKQVQQLQDYLKECGKASIVLTEESITKDTVTDVFNCIQSQHCGMENATNIFEEHLFNVRLALNAVGGSSVDKLLLFLSNNGTVVTYGGMSREPITVDTSQFIFRNIDLTGYWHSRWMVQQYVIQEKHRRSKSIVEDARVTMINALVDALLDRRLECPPIQSFALHGFQNAFAASPEIPTIRQKIVFDCREE